MGTVPLRTSVLRASPPRLSLYKVELWAKYSGAANYDQPLHRDFGNHTLVVPRRYPILDLDPYRL
jgi:hypothetical protein